MGVGNSCMFVHEDILSMVREPVSHRGTDRSGQTDEQRQTGRHTEHITNVDLHSMCLMFLFSQRESEHHSQPGVQRESGRRQHLDGDDFRSRWRHCQCHRCYTATRWRHLPRWRLHMESRRHESCKHIVRIYFSNSPHFTKPTPMHEIVLRAARYVKNTMSNHGLTANISTQDKWTTLFSLS